MTDERVAVVTGASSGVGRAIAIAMARAGLSVFLTGRDRARLEETAASIRQVAPVQTVVADLARDDDLRTLVRAIAAKPGRVDVLVHAAGAIQTGTLSEASLGQFDAQYRTNVRAPYALTQGLAARLARAQGQVVFINSSVGLSVNRPEIAQYAASKHALKAVADALRSELNPLGVRVLSVYLGRTATPMQARRFREEHKEYRPDELLQPTDVADLLVSTLALPRTAEVTDISIRPARPPSPADRTLL